ncbi:DUF3788 domain-containing protein [Candidatus Dependentiae bacterium]|nr:DUF3788 domain-containing protein [Candidatus Dependentiae bacterium]
MEKFERFLNRDDEPSDSEYEQEMGKRVFKTYQKLNDYLKAAYEVDPIPDSGGKKYGWNYKYRKSSKTICTLFPEKKAFTVLVTLGKYDLEKLKPDLKKLSPELQKLIKDTHHYHDGKWLWIRIPTTANIADIKLLTSLKRKPKKPS